MRLAALVPGGNSAGRSQGREPDQPRSGSRRLCAQMTYEKALRKLNAGWGRRPLSKEEPHAYRRPVDEGMRPAVPSRGQRVPPVGRIEERGELLIHSGSCGTPTRTL